MELPPLLSCFPCLMRIVAPKTRTVWDKAAIELDSAGLWELSRDGNCNQTERREERGETSSGYIHFFFFFQLRYLQIIEVSFILGNAILYSTF